MFFASGDVFCPRNQVGSSCKGAQPLYLQQNLQFILLKERPWRFSRAFPARGLSSNTFRACRLPSCDRFNIVAYKLPARMASGKKRDGGWMDSRGYAAESPVVASCVHSVRPFYATSFPRPICSSEMRHRHVNCSGLPGTRVPVADWTGRCYPDFVFPYRFCWL